MSVYETSATVQAEGNVAVSGVPFPPGTVVDVTIHPKRRTAEDFRTAWEQVCLLLRASPVAGQISDQAIQQEIDDYRAGR